MRHYLPSQKYLNECFLYDHETGKLYWRKRPVSHFIRGFAYNRWNLLHAGSEIKTLTSKSKRGMYYRVKLNKTSYQAHRVIFKMLHNEEPECIDHIDGNGLNNKPSNLRKANVTINSRNMRRFSTNKSGVTGVSWSSGKNKWQVCISVNNKSRHLGYYSSLDDAKNAYQKAKSRFGFHELHGEIKERPPEFIL